MDRREFLKNAVLAAAGLAGRKFVGSVTPEEAKSWKLSGRDVAEIVCIIDRSGSMGGTEEETIKSFNDFLVEQQALPGKAALTLTLFNHEYDIVLDGVDVQAVKGLSRDTYVPGGMTALLDAVGRTVGDVRARVHKLAKNDRPEKVIFLILTDGYENASREYQRDQLKAVIEECQEEDGWKFLFFGANQDAWLTSESFGVSSQFATAYAATPKGTRSVYSVAAAATTSFRRTADSATWATNWDNPDGTDTTWMDVDAITTDEDGD